MLMYYIRCPHCGVRLELTHDQIDRERVCKECEFKFVAPVTGIMAGVTTDGFWVKRRITGGAVSEIFEAQKTATGEKMLLKVLCPLMTVDSEEGAIDTYMAWVERAREVDHPNWVTSLENGQIMDHLYLAYPMVSGTCLDAYLAEHGPMAERDVLKAGLKVVRTLESAWNEHAALHLGIKPSNLLLDAEQQIFLLDPGHYRLLLPLADPSLQRLSGSPANYFAPEQIMGQADLDLRTDMYMLGATLYHLATGAPPFAGGDVAEVFGAILQADLPPPSRVKDGINPAFDELVLRLMARDRDRRFGTWADVAKAMKNILKGNRKSTTQTRLNLLPPTPDDADSAISSSAAPPGGPAKSNKALILGLVAVLVGAVCLLILVLVFTGGGDGSAPPPPPPPPTETVDPRLKAFEAQYNAAMRYADEHPDDLDTAMGMLRQLRNDAVNTEYQYKAQDGISELRKRRGAGGSDTGAGDRD